MIFENITGNYKKINGIYRNVSGIISEVNKKYENQNGVNKKVYENLPDIWTIETNLTHSFQVTKSIRLEVDYNFNDTNKEYINDTNVIQHYWGRTNKNLPPLSILLKKYTKLQGSITWVSKDSGSTYGTSGHSGDMSTIPSWWGGGSWSWQGNWIGGTKTFTMSFNTSYNAFKLIWGKADSSVGYALKVTMRINYLKLLI